MTEQETPAGVNDSDSLAAIVGALRDRFGDDAKKVARIQLDAADGLTRDHWQIILDQLSH